MFISHRNRSDLLQGNLVHSLSQSRLILLRLLAIVRMSNDLDTSALFPLGVFVVDVRRWNRIDHRHEIYLQTRSDSLVGVCILCLWVSSADCHPVHDTVSHGRFHEHFVRISVWRERISKVKSICFRSLPAVGFLMTTDSFGHLLFLLCFWFAWVFLDENSQRKWKSRCSFQANIGFFLLSLCASCTHVPNDKEAKETRFAICAKKFDGKEQIVFLG